jgi:hypothetical protein
MALKRKKRKRKVERINPKTLSSKGKENNTNRARRGCFNFSGEKIPRAVSGGEDFSNLE